MSTLHYRHAFRDAVHASERATRAEAELQRLRYTEPPPLSIRQLVIAMAVWAALLAVGLWLSAHDPDYLSRLVQRVTGGAR